MANHNAVGARVDKVIRIVASSPTSWSEAARNAVNEASKTIHGLATARLIDTDIFVRDSITLYRVKLELQFRLDRNRTDAAGEPVQVRRYLIVANQTLATAGLQELVNDKLASSAAEFHVLVPQADPTVSVDLSGVISPNMPDRVLARHDLAVAEAEQRLASFKRTFANLGPSLTTEVAAGDPVAAIRRIMERSSFDEIIISTLPVGISRWLKIDLPTRIERAFNLPLTTLVQRD